MAVRSDRLAGPTAIPAGNSALLFTVPADETWIVKYVAVTNTGVVTSTNYVFARRAGIDGGLLDGAMPAARTTATPGGFWCALDPGTEVHALAGVAPMTVLVSGAKLAGAVP